MKFYNKLHERFIEAKSKVDRTKSVQLNPFDLNLVLLDNCKKDMEIGNFLVKKSIDEIESIVAKNEDLRDYKMKIEFEKEKDSILHRQNQIKKEIELIANKNMNEQVINLIKEETNKQQDLYDKYFMLNRDVETMIKNQKENMPEQEEKVKRKSDKLKKRKLILLSCLVNRENLKLLEKIKKIENEKKTEILEKSITQRGCSVLIDEKLLSETRLEEPVTLAEISKIGRNVTSTGQLISEFDKENRSINITDLVSSNENLKEKFENLKKLKNKLYQTKREHRFVSNELGQLNTKNFYSSKLFTEGMHEISKELFKIHELQLDKIITSKSADTNCHLYLRLYKENTARNLKVPYADEEELILPKISHNIKKKYNFPVVEKSEPSSFIYKAINHMIEENNMSDIMRKLSFRDKRIEWEEFRDLSAYQIHTMLTLNKELIKFLESKIYPSRNIHT